MGLSDSHHPHVLSSIRYLLQSTLIFFLSLLVFTPSRWLLVGMCIAKILFAPVGGLEQVQSWSKAGSVGWRVGEPWLGLGWLRLSSCRVETETLLYSFEYTRSGRLAACRSADEPKRVKLRSTVCLCPSPREQPYVKVVQETIVVRGYHSWFLFVVVIFV